MDKNINISSVKQDFKNLRHTISAHRIEVQCSKNYFKIFLPPEAGAFGNDVVKEPQKPHQQLKKYVIHIFEKNSSSACAPMQVIGFCRHVLFSWNNDSNFLPLKVA